MQPIGELIASGIKGLGDTVKQFVTTDKDRLELDLELKKLAVSLQMKALEYEQDIVKAKAEIIVAEAGGQSWIQRNWRPLIMLSFGFIIIYQKFLAPVFHLQSVELEDKFWNLLEIGMGGYVFGRTVEKIMPEVKEIFKPSVEDRIDRRERRIEQRERIAENRDRREKEKK